jgi:hypothetical protein
LERGRDEVAAQRIDVSAGIEKVSTHAELRR